MDMLRRLISIFISPCTAYKLLLLLFTHLRLTGLGEEKLRWPNPTNTYAVPWTPSLMGDRSFTVAGLRLGNNLPVEILQPCIVLATTEDVSH